ncbi:hypothetical protein MVES1_000576 [Malassezia vespertilionis]|uniref:Uncharacterized protein n=1 Tax=Malassezia vespertilionis TaxID=2020962 RepID=A0A2N1JGB3_9BASI|nr:uncharacterized protein MVES1_000576 [Malassezia vespertilionis]PKI85576.1 hypothetical protein MVES_000533 [Malassezia vespertilionis]WFD05248.1 hypothetical protein MVES1_000576 [Malassezia vespertilionis]
MADDPFAAVSAAVTDAPAQHVDTDVDKLAQTIENRVTDFVGGISSWWSDVSKQSSVMATAKKEIARIDSSMEEASTAARASNYALQQEADDGNQAANEALQEKGKARVEEAERKAFTSASLSALGAAAWSSLQQLAHTPQAEQIQQRFMSTMRQSDTSIAEGSEEYTKYMQETLKDAEAFALRQLQQGEALARGVSNDLRGLLDEIVKVVPPEETKSAPVHELDDATHVQGAPTQPTEDKARDTPRHEPSTQAWKTERAADDFAWDEASDEEEEQVAPQVPSQVSPQAAPPSAESAHASAEDSDSDWE